MSYRDATLDWLERQSDINLLRQFENKLDDIPGSKKRDLKNKGYIRYSFDNRRLYLTQKGRELLYKENEPPYPFI